MADNGDDNVELSENSSGERRHKKKSMSFGETLTQAEQKNQFHFFA